MNPLGPKNSDVGFETIRWIFECLAAYGFVEGIVALRDRLEAEAAEAMLKSKYVTLLYAKLLIKGEERYLNSLLNHLPEGGLASEVGYDEILSATKVQAVVEECRTVNYDAGVQLAENVGLADDDSDAAQTLLPLLKGGTKAAKQSLLKRILDKHPFAAYVDKLRAFVTETEELLPPPFLEQVLADIRRGDYTPDVQLSLPALRAAERRDEPTWRRVVAGQDRDTAAFLSSAAPARAHHAPAPAPVSATSPLPRLRLASATLKERGVDPLPAALQRGTQAQESVARRLALPHRAPAPAPAPPAAHDRPRSPQRRSVAPPPPPPVADEAEPEDVYAVDDEDEAPPSPAAPRLQSPRVPVVPALAKKPAPAPAAAAGVKRRAPSDDEDEEGGAHQSGHSAVDVQSSASAKAAAAVMRAGEARRRRRWTTEEEMALMEGVRTHGAGAWKAILLSARAVFGDRSQVDLKDKWRNMNSKSARPAPADE